MGLKRIPAISYTIIYRNQLHIWTQLSHCTVLIPDSVRLKVRVVFFRLYISTISTISPSVQSLQSFSSRRCMSNVGARPGAGQQAHSGSYAPERRQPSGLGSALTGVDIHAVINKYTLRSVIVNYLSHINCQPFCPNLKLTF